MFQFFHVARAQLMKNLSWVYLGTLLSSGLTLVYSLVLAKQLGQETFGHWVLAIAFSQLIFNLFEVRLSEFITKFFTKFINEDSHSLALAFVRLSRLTDISSTGVAYLFLFLLAGFADQHLLQTGLGTTLVLLAGLDLTATNFLRISSTALLRFYDRFRVIAITETLFSFLRLVFTLVGLSYYEFGVIEVLYLSIAIQALTTLSLYAFSRHAIQSELSGARNVAPFALLRQNGAEMKKFVFNSYLFSLSAIPDKSLDINILGYFMSPAAVAAYKVAKDVLKVIWKLGDPIVAALTPEIAKIWHSDGGAPKAKKLLFSFSKSAVGVAFVLFILGLGAAYVLEQNLFEANGDSIFLLYTVMASCVVVWIPLLWTNPLLMMSGHPNLCVRVAMISAPTLVLLYLALTPQWGALGTAIAYSVGVVVQSIVSFAYARRVLA